MKLAEWEQKISVEFMTKKEELFQSKTQLNDTERYVDSEISEKQNLIIKKYEEIIKYNDYLKNQNLDLISKNNLMSQELKEIRKKLKKIVTEKPQDQICHLPLEEEKKIAKITIEKLSNENNLLKRALEKEQVFRIEKNKQILSLEEKLKITEQEMKKSEEIRYNLSVDIQTLQSNMQKLTEKLNDLENFSQTHINNFDDGDSVVNHYTAIELP